MDTKPIFLSIAVLVLKSIQEGYGGSGKYKNVWTRLALGKGKIMEKENVELLKKSDSLLKHFFTLLFSTSFTLPNIQIDCKQHHEA